MKLVFIGAPGSGKGTLAKKLAEKFNITHISTGDMIRENIKNETPIGLAVKDILSRGDLVSDEMMKDIVDATLKLPKNSRGYILDGFPRTLDQAQWFMSNFEVDKYIIFDISQDTIIERISGRRVHNASGRIYHTKFAPPKVADKDDETGEPLVQRDDDMPEKVLHRFAVYQELTHPIITFIEKQVQGASETGSANCVHINAEPADYIVLENVVKILS